MCTLYQINMKLYIVRYVYAFFNAFIFSSWHLLPSNLSGLFEVITTCEALETPGIVGQQLLYTFIAEQIVDSICFCFHFVCAVHLYTECFQKLDFVSCIFVTQSLVLCLVQWQPINFYWVDEYLIGKLNTQHQVANFSSTQSSSV